MIRDHSSQGSCFQWEAPPPRLSPLTAWRPSYSLPQGGRKDGSFSRIELDGQTYFGRELMNHCETLARQAYFAPTNTQVRAHAKDFMWYLWCGKNSPLFGRNVKIGRAHV